MCIFACPYLGVLQVHVCTRSEEEIETERKTVLGAIAILQQPLWHLTLSCVRAQSDVDTESIGNVVCRKADEIGACALVLSGRSKSRLQRFFLGSVTNHCVHHCKIPVMVVH